MRDRCLVDAASRACRRLSVAGIAMLVAACGVAAAPVDAGSSAARSPTSVPAPQSPTSSPSPPSTTDLGPTVTAPLPPPTDAAGTALALLATLEVKGRAPKTGYDRAQFGQRWADVDRNGCDTRNDVLRRDLTGTELKPGTNGCVAVSGTLLDPFSGNEIPFVRGEDTSGAVQIDHVVALSDAWQKGAQQWTPEQRLAFANDPLNLIAVAGNLNASKGDGDAATWLPPNRAFRCAYVARQVAVKARYRAWVTEAERNAIATVLADCPAEPVPAGVLALAPAQVPPPPPPPITPAPPPAEAPGGSCDAAYPDVCIPPFAEVGDLDCGDVQPRRFAVQAPDPHGFDGNHDGVGCEG